MIGLVLVVKFTVVSLVAVVLCNVCSDGTTSKPSSDASSFSVLLITSPLSVPLFTALGSVTFSWGWQQKQT